MSGGSNAPIIIKRKKVVAGGGHHGGAWKVAYADFVTAMMAFFLLMWLLNATTEKQRKGIADFFNPTIPINRISGGGDGALGGDSVFTEETLAQNGVGATAIRAEIVTTGELQETKRLQEIENELVGGGGEAMFNDNELLHVFTEVTDEGLVVELFALEGKPLFASGTDEPTELLRDLVRVVANVFALSPNRIAIEGHSRARPIVVAENPTWPLSLMRAAATQTLVADALPANRIRRVTGHGDREPATSNPLDARNDRMELILLRTEK